MALPVEKLPETGKEVYWRNTIRGQLYRCKQNTYLVLCNQSNQAVAMNSGEGAKHLGDTWSPGSESLWVPVNATLTVTGDE